INRPIRIRHTQYSNAHPVTHTTATPISQQALQAASGRTTCHRTRRDPPQSPRDPIAGTRPGGRPDSRRPVRFWRHPTPCGDLGHLVGTADAFSGGVTAGGGAVLGTSDTKWGPGTGHGVSEVPAWCPSPHFVHRLRVRVAGICSGGAQSASFGSLADLRAKEHPEPPGEAAPRAFGRGSSPGLVATLLSGSGIAASFPGRGGVGQESELVPIPKGREALLTHTSTTSTIRQPGDATTSAVARRNHLRGRQAQPPPRSPGPTTSAVARPNHLRRRQTQPPPPSPDPTTSAV
ncbi:hypothetical protein EV642_109275, partial [Kribbella sp. VKM Ac-2500]